MNDQLSRNLATYIHMRDFCTTHADALPKDSYFQEVLSDLDTVITEIETRMAAQDSGKRSAKEGTKLKSVAHTALCENLEAMSRTARAVALKVQGLEDKFRLPRSASAQGWLTVARAFAQDAVPFKDEFIRRGMPESFLEDLQAAIEDYEQALNRRAQHKGSHVAATAGINEADERGMNCRVELDAIVQNVFRHDPITLAEWTSASHVVRPKRRRKAAATPDTPAK